MSPEAIPATVESPDPTGLTTLMLGIFAYKIFDYVLQKAPSLPNETIIHSISLNIG